MRLNLSFFLILPSLKRILPSGTQKCLRKNMKNPTHHFSLTRKRAHKLSPTHKSQVLLIQSTRSRHPKNIRRRNFSSFQYPKASDTTQKGHLIFVGQGFLCTLSLLPSVSSPDCMSRNDQDLSLPSPTFSDRKLVLLSTSPK